MLKVQTIPEARKRTINAELRTHGLEIAGGSVVNRNQIYIDLNKGVAATYNGKKVAWLIKTLPEEYLGTGLSKVILDGRVFNF